MPTPAITFSKLKDLVFEHLEDTVGEVDDWEVTFAKVEEAEWHVNAEFVVKGNRHDTPETALFSVDGTTGDVTVFQKGHIWRS